MSLYASLFRPKATPQSEPMDARQVANSAGGYVFAIDDWARLDPLHQPTTALSTNLRPIQVQRNDARPGAERAR